MSWRDSLIKYLPYLLLILVGAGWGWREYHKSPDVANTVVLAAPAKEIKGAPTTVVPIKKGVVVIKNVKKKLSLPSTIIDDKSKEVVASSKVAAGEHSHTVTTVIDTETGKSETYVRTDPLPWISYENRGNIGVYYGIKDSKQAMRLQVQQDFIQTKSLHIGVVGSIDRSTNMPTSYFVGVGVNYKW